MINVGMDNSFELSKSNLFIRFLVNGIIQIRGNEVSKLLQYL